jgi:uroporphyrinogen III methyltransferase / synthase
LKNKLMASTEPNSFLSGRTVVIIGPEILTPEFRDELHRRGAEVNTLPDVEIVEPEHYDRIDEALNHLYGYDWLLFTSPHGVEYFVRRLQHKEVDAHQLDELRVCAVGEETEERLRIERLHVDVVPPAERTMEVFAALSQFLGGFEALGGLNFLSPRASGAHDSLTRALSEANARVDLVPAYRVRLANGLDPGREAAMLSGAADCLVLTCPESLMQLQRLFDSYDLRSALAQASISCFDEATAKAAAACGLKASRLPNNPSATEFAEAIDRHNRN